MNKTKIGLLVLLIVILVGIAFAYNLSSNNLSSGGNPAASTAAVTATTSTGEASAAVSSASTTMTIDTSNWQTLSSSTTGVTFEYPTVAELALNYIQTVDWPPYISVSNSPFSCTQSGSTVGPEGKTTLETINGSTYCVNEQGEGAAGSVYDTYAYSFPGDNKTLTLNFILRYPQCENYPDPDMTECKNEESAFDVDTLADDMARTVQYVRLVSPAQPIKPVAPPTSAVELDSISPTSGPVGTTMTLTGAGFMEDDKVLFNGNVAASDAHPASAADGNQSLTITVPSSIGPDCQPDQACPLYEELVTPNTYLVTVQNTNGTSNAVSFIVTANQ